MIIKNLDSLRNGKLLRYGASIALTCALLSAFAPVHAGLASRIASEIASELPSETKAKVVRKALQEKRASQDREDEFETLARSIPKDLTAKQGQGAAVLISVVYRYRFADALAADLRVSKQDYERVVAQFQSKVSLAEKTRIKTVVNLHMFCQQQMEPYLESFLRKPEVQTDAQRQAALPAKINLQRCSSKMKTLPGVPADFSTGYSELITKMEELDAAHKAKKVLPDDSSFVSAKLMLNGLKASRERMDEDFKNIFKGL